MRNRDQQVNELCTVLNVTLRGEPEPAPQAAQGGHLIL